MGKGRERLRVCKRCGRELPLTPEYFFRDRSATGGFRYACKKCLHPHDKRYYNKLEKECSDCHNIFPWTEEYFNKNTRRWNGLNTICKKCVGIRGRNRYNKIKDTLRYKEINKRAQEKRRATKNAEIREYNNRYYEGKYNNDLQFKLLSVLRQRVRNALKGEVKEETTKELLGCTIDYFKTWIESKFESGMTWMNHGRGEGMWHLDHIKPCAMFDLSNIEQRHECFHFSNYQPLWEGDNLEKHAWYNGVFYSKNNKELWEKGKSAFVSSRM